MSIFEALTLFLVMLPLAAMPSSSVALVVARSASAGRRNGAVAALGIVAGDLVFIAMALAGMSVLADWLGALFAVVKYCAGAYLIWLGFSLFKPRSPQMTGGTTNTATSFAADFSAGFFLTLGDIKAILFYASFFPMLVDMESIGVPEVVLIAAITVATVGGVKLAYALLASTLVKHLRGRISSNIPRKLGGAMLISCGSAMIVKA